MFTTSAAAGTDGDEDGEGDAAVVGALLGTTGILTPVTALAEAAGWPLRRTRDALEELEARLPVVGQRLHRQPGKAAIVRAATVGDSERTKALLRIHLNRDGLSAGEARLLRRIAAGDIPKNPSNAETVALGVLVNAELVVTDDRGAKQAPGWKVADDVDYSLLVDDQGRSST